MHDESLHAAVLQGNACAKTKSGTKRVQKDSCFVE